MKRILLSLSLLTILSVTTSAQTRSTTQKKAAVTKPITKYNDNIDDRMKGPDGEKIYIGEKGGRYYLKNGKKIYVEHRSKKKKA